MKVPPTCSAWGPKKAPSIVPVAAPAPTVPVSGMSKLPSLLNGALPLTSKTDAWLISVEIER
jgi:hypothetical protein